MWSDDVVYVVVVVVVGVVSCQEDVSRWLCGAGCVAAAAHSWPEKAPGAPSRRFSVTSLTLKYHH